MLIKDGTLVPLLFIFNPSILPPGMKQSSVVTEPRVSGRVGRGPCWHCSVKVVSAGVGGQRLVHVDGVEDPLCELLQLGRGAVRLLHQALVVLSQAFNLCLQRRLCVLLLVVTQPWMILSVTTWTKCYTCSGFPCEEVITHLLQILLEHLHHRLQLTDFSHQAGWGLSGRCTVMV